MRFLGRAPFGGSSANHRGEEGDVPNR
jgi:hypothetical protein